MMSPMLSVLLFENSKIGSRGKESARLAGIPEKGEGEVMEGSGSRSPGGGAQGSAGQGHQRTSSGATSRSLSLASVSSEGSERAEQPLVEQEDIVSLTQEVRGFKEALGKLRRVFGPEKVAEKGEIPRVTAHDRLGEVLRILRGILERYSPLQSTELLMAAGALIQQVKGFPYEDEKADPADFFETLDNLALAFSSRVSEYLMGDLDSSSSLTASSTKTKSCENLASLDQDVTSEDKEPEQLTPELMDAILLRLEQGVEYALHRAKIWSKYAKDMMGYVEKRAQLELEYARNVAKLAQSVRPTLKEEGFLPFQSIYCTALDQDLENANTTQATCTLLQGHKFIEPLTARRTEHERCRKQLKDTWAREVKKMQEAAANVKKAKSLYMARAQEHRRAKEAAQQQQAQVVTASTPSTPHGSMETQPFPVSQDAVKLEKKRKLEDDALQKALEAETTYKACVAEANERHASLLRVKSQVLSQVRELMLQCDQTMKAVTVAYFQLQHTVSAAPPVQFQTLCESSRLYEPGSQYMEFVKRLPRPPLSTEGGEDTPEASPFVFEPISTPLLGSRHQTGSMDKNRPSEGSLGPEQPEGVRRSPLKAWIGSGIAQYPSDTDSIASSQSGRSVDHSPTPSPGAELAYKRVPSFSTDDGESAPAVEPGGKDSGNGVSRRHCMSKAAVTHNFRKLKTPARCRECDSFVYLGVECAECGLASHKKCLETLAIQCGHKRLPRKMTTFGVDIEQHLKETSAHIPHLVIKCVSEIEKRGMRVKGIYRVSGVKSRVEKLCQSFENGADLVDLTDTHPNVVANVLKLYLRQLPEPLLTFRLYSEFIRVAKESDSPSSNPKKTLDGMRELVRRLPPTHFDTVAYLMRHLHRVSLESDLNNMPPSNLGIVFGPTLLRMSEGSASLNSLVDTVHQTKAIEILIDNSNEIFGSADHATAPHVPVSKAEGTPRSLSVESSDSNFLSRMPLVRSLSSVGKKALGKDTEIVSTTMEKRDPEVNDEINIPGFIETPPADDTQPEESLTNMSLTSDDDLPILLPDDSGKRSPLIRRSAPVDPSTRHQILRKSASDVPQGQEGASNSRSTKARAPPPPTESFAKSNSSPLLVAGSRLDDIAFIDQSEAPGSPKPHNSSIDSDYSFDGTECPRGKSLQGDVDLEDGSVFHRGSLDNLTSSESSQDVDSLPVTEDSQSSEFADEPDVMSVTRSDDPDPSLRSTTTAVTSVLHSKYTEGGSKYVSPYLNSTYGSRLYRQPLTASDGDANKVKIRVPASTTEKLMKSIIAGDAGGPKIRLPGTDLFEFNSQAAGKVGLSYREDSTTVSEAVKGLGGGVRSGDGIHSGDGFLRVTRDVSGFSSSLPSSALVAEPSSASFAHRSRDPASDSELVQCIAVTRGQYV